MSRLLFVGERPSRTAARMGVTWADGRLAAKQLFDALRRIGLDPGGCRYDNLFVPDPDGPEVVCRRAARRLRAAVARGDTLVAMGRKVAAYLAEHALPHRHIVHPAARGRIRKKARYARHLREVLLCPSTPAP